MIKIPIFLLAIIIVIYLVIIIKVESKHLKTHTKINKLAFNRYLNNNINEKKTKNYKNKIEKSFFETLK
jgi:uncharacterized membrane protein